MKRIFITMVTATALGLTMTPVAAQEWSKRDPVGDLQGPSGWGGDIVRVKAAHRQHRLVVNTVFRTHGYDSLTIRIDTNKRRPGPEYDFYRASDGFGGGVSVYDRVRRRTVKCPKLKVRMGSRQKVWRASIPRDCIKPPGGKRRPQVRIRVISEGYGDPYTFDWAPAKHRMSPWIKSG